MEVSFSLLILFLTNIYYLKSPLCPTPLILFHIMYFSASEKSQALFPYCAHLHLLLQPIIRRMHTVVFVVCCSNLRICLCVNMRCFSCLGWWSGLCFLLDVFAAVTQKHTAMISSSLHFNPLNENTYYFSMDFFSLCAAHTKTVNKKPKTRSKNKENEDLLPFTFFLALLINS